MGFSYFKHVTWTINRGVKAEKNVHYEIYLSHSTLDDTIQKSRVFAGARSTNSLMEKTTVPSEFIIKTTFITDVSDWN